LYRVDSLEDQIAKQLDDIIDSQEEVTLAAIAAPAATSLLSLGSDSNFASVVPTTELAVSTIPLLASMRSIYEQAVSDNIQEGFGQTVSEQQAEAAVSEHLATVNEFNNTTRDQVTQALAAASVAQAEDGGDIDVVFKAILAATLVKAVFNKLRSSRKRMIIDSAVLGPYNQGLFDSASNSDVVLKKQWVSLKDERVRVPHKQLHGDIVPVSSPFFVNGVPIRFPKDPVAPPSLTINCRCVLKFSR